MHNGREGMSVTQPSSHTKQTQLLPGSEERELKLVGSLQELKDQLEHDNRILSVKKRRINMLIIISSLVALCGLVFLTPGEKSKRERERLQNLVDSGMASDKDIRDLQDSTLSSKAMQIYKYFGYALAIGSLIKGFNGRANYLNVVHPKPKTEDSQYSELDSSNYKDRLRIMVTRAFVDVTIRFGLMSRTELKSRVRALQYKPTTEVARKLINELATYDPAR